MDGSVILLLIVYSMGNALLCMIVAEAKGGSSGWFFAGLVLGIFGLIGAAGLPDRRGITQSGKIISLKKCPDCAEDIKLEARVCRYCGRQFTDDDTRNHFIDVLRNSNPSAIMNILPRLSAQQDEQLIPPMLDAISKIGKSIPNQFDQGNQAYRSLIDILKEWENPVVIPAVAKLLKDGPAYLRLPLIELIGKFKTEECASLLTDLIEDSAVADEVVGALRRIGASARNPLEKVLKVGSRSARKKAE